MCRRSTSSAWMTAHSELTGFQNPPSARRHTYRFSPTWTKSPRAVSETLRQDEFGKTRLCGAGAFSIERLEVSRFGTTVLCVLNCVFG
jgi:hypothetical protein